MSKEETIQKFEYTRNTLKIGDLRVNINSAFIPKKSLHDILYTIASVRLKEKSA
jgi:hypothetical protein